MGGAALRTGDRLGGLPAHELHDADLAGAAAAGAVRRGDAVGAQLFLGLVAHPVGGPGRRELGDDPRRDAGLLQADAGVEAVEYLYSDLLKSNCPVTGQPDWASVHLRYRGPRIDRTGLLRYLVGFREHAGFHEQCVEQIFLDLLQRCRPAQLSVEARYTRRGGLDINPWRATPGCTAPPALRDLRQ